MLGLRLSFGLLFMLSGICMSGCQTAEIGVSEVLNTAHCHGLKRGFSQVQWRDLPRIRGVRMLTDPPTQQQPSAQAPLDSNAALQLFAIFNGAKPTAGYHLELVSAEAVKQEIQLHYVMHSPPADAVLAQVQTAPCSIVQVEPNPKVSAISAWLDDTLLGRVALNAEP